MNVAEMYAGRELDALVAERVFGCKPEYRELGWNADGGPKAFHCTCEDLTHADEDDDRSGWAIYRYSTAPAAALKLLARFDAYDINKRDHIDGSHFSVALYNRTQIKPVGTATGPTLPLAACRAALLAAEGNKA